MDVDEITTKKTQILPIRKKSVNKIKQKRKTLRNPLYTLTQ